MFDCYTPIELVLSVDVHILQLLFDLNPDMAFFVKNRAGQYIAVNDSLIARHGLKRKSDALGKRPQDICPGDFGRLPTEQDQRVLSTGKPLIDYLELQWYRPGAAVWCLTSKLPLKDEQGQVIGLIGFSRDLRAPVGTEEIPLGFARAIAEFETDLSQPFSPAILAKRSGLSSNRLGRLTKRLFSLTPSQLLAKTRVAAASLLLRESSLSIVDIAHHCGYADQSAFTRAFRTLTSVTPSEFRRSEALPKN
ncbi:MAG: AraC family transcriptional regulator [Pirellulaceae bacterium]|nr:AraC family transcriptional regulator [Pirellulaceae bacterium]